MTITGASTATTGNGAGPPVSVGVVAGGVVVGGPVGVVVVPVGVVVVPVGVVVGTGNPLDTHTANASKPQSIWCALAVQCKTYEAYMLYIYHGEEVCMVNIQPETDDRGRGVYVPHNTASST